MMKREWLAALILVIMLVASLPTPTSAAETYPMRVLVTDINELGFTVTWTTNDSTEGYIQWADVPDPAAWNTTYDDRGDAAFTNDTHRCKIKGLTYDTFYYFRILSGGTTYLNGSQPWAMNTTKIRSIIPGMHKVIRYLYMAGDVPAEGTIAYMTMDGSMPLSYLVSSTGYFQFSCSYARWRDAPNKVYSNDMPFQLRFEGANRGFHPLDGGWLTGYTVDTSSFPQDLGDFYLQNFPYLNPGLNLITLPMDTPYTTVGDLAADIASNTGCELSEIIRWTPSGWSSWIAAIPWVNNYTLHPGDCYFVRVIGTGGTWLPTGSAFTEAQALALDRGWTGIGIPFHNSSTLHASDIMSQIDEQNGVGTCEGVARWSGAGWDIYTGVSADDFELDDARNLRQRNAHGIFVRCNASGTYTPL